jgi:HEPN domain-containing protein
MSGDDRELAHDRRLTAMRWLEAGIEDLDVARLCVEACKPFPGSAAYHCQQAAEKLIKGLLVLADIPFTKTHNLRRLGTLAEPRYSTDVQLLEAAYSFTAWAFDYRYPASDPDPPDEPTDDDYDRQ